jgi:hypothetical protein
MNRYYLLYRQEGEVRAAERILADAFRWPERIEVEGVMYHSLGESTFFFWDELRDAEGATVGYTFLLEESPTFRASHFISDSSNVLTLDDDDCMPQEIRILLEPCPEPEWESVQGFGSDVYVSALDPKDCVLLMFDWSENRKAFTMHPKMISLT